MPLIELWTHSPEQLRDKHVQQIIAFAGSGRLSDGEATSEEFRVFLRTVPSNILARYAIECLRDRFEGSGYALQDVVNQIGERMGFTVTHGRYRGARGHNGFDGLWHAKDGHGIVVEVKTTDVYRIALSQIVRYQQSLVEAGAIREGRSSVLLVVARQDTDGLEAQIRGSKHAWNVRLITVDGLLRLLRLKEEMGHPDMVREICKILVPTEYTKLDRIIELVFFLTAELTAERSHTREVEHEPPVRTEKPGIVPLGQDGECIARMEQLVRTTLAI